MRTTGPRTDSFDKPTTSDERPNRYHAFRRDQHQPRTGGEVCRVQRVDRIMSISRRWLASGSALAAAGAMYALGPYTEGHGVGPKFHDFTWLALWMPVLLLTSSVFLPFSRTVGAQLFARAVWWSHLVLGGIIAMCANGTDHKRGIAMAIASAAALLFAGREQLASPTSAFAPNMFRGSLTAILVMALADVQSLLLFGMIGSSDNGGGMGILSTLLLLIAGVMAIAVYGLFRLRMWALVLTALADVALVGLMSQSGALPGGLRTAYVVSAAVQIALMLPIVMAIVRRAPAKA